MKKNRLTENDLLHIEKGKEHKEAEKNDRAHPTVGMLVNEIAKLFSIALKQKIPSEAGLTYSRRMILHYLSHHENASLSDLVENSHLSAASLSIELSQMEKCSLIEKTKNEQDHRSVCLNLTEEGKELNRRIRESLNSLDEILMSGIEESQQALLCMLLKTVRDSVLAEIIESEE